MIQEYCFIFVLIFIHIHGSVYRSNHIIYTSVKSFQTLGGINTAKTCLSPDHKKVGKNVTLFYRAHRIYCIFVWL